MDICRLCGYHSVAGRTQGGLTYSNLRSNGLSQPESVV